MSLPLLRRCGAASQLVLMPHKKNNIILLIILLISMMSHLARRMKKFRSSWNEAARVRLEQEEEVCRKEEEEVEAALQELIKLVKAKVKRKEAQQRTKFNAGSSSTRPEEEVLPQTPAPEEIITIPDSPLKIHREGKAPA